jgi:hypothetical protein
MQLPEWPLGPLKGDSPMSDIKTTPRYQVGDKVRFVHGSRLVGSVMHVQGIHSPRGRILYEIYVPMDPEPLIMPAREEDIEKVDP